MIYTSPIDGQHEPPYRAGDDNEQQSSNFEYLETAVIGPPGLPLAVSPLQHVPDLEPGPVLGRQRTGFISPAVVELANKKQAASPTRDAAHYPTKDMTMTMIAQHKEFTLEVQLQLDRMWDTWSRCDKNCAEAGYENDHLNAESDRLWSEYNAALKAAYRAQAQAEADEIVQRHGSSIRQQLAQAGFRQMSRRLTAVSAVQ